MGVALTSPKLECLAGRYVLISGGMAGKACHNSVLWLDAHSPPAAGAPLGALAGGALAGTTGAIASAGDDASGAVLFFDGAAGELITLP
jgi:hypothetical protein